MPTETDKLKIKLIQPTDMFADDAFNNIIKDLDNKVVGIAHLTSGAHWEVWTKNTDYVKGDIVRTPYLKSNQYLECTSAGKTGTDCPNDNIPGTMITDNTAKWIIRVLGAVDESTISIWIGGEEYRRGSLVLYNNKLYRCKVPHTATTFDADSSNWQEVFASLQEWKATFYYALNDTVLYDGKLFKCILANDDTVFDANKWSLINNLSIVYPYEQNTNYIEGQLVTVNGKLYKSKTTHLSPTGNFTADKVNWESIYSDIVRWNNNVDYYVGDIVSFDDVMYICKIAHTSSSTSFKLDKDNWNIYHTPSSFIKDWVANAVYELEQVVRYKKRIYRCKVKNADSSWNELNWELINLDIEDWTASTNYYVGQYVSYNGTLYRCITANSDSAWTSSNWKKVSGGINNWVTGVSYSVDDLVIYNDRIYQCNTAHTSGSAFDSTKWSEISKLEHIIVPWTTKTDYKIGDLVYYENVIYKANKAHTSTTFSADAINWDNMYSNIREYVDNTFYKAGSCVLYNNNIYVASKDTTENIGKNVVKEVNNIGFNDSANEYTKTNSDGSVTEPNGDYINTVIDLGSMLDVTQVILSSYTQGYCDVGQTDLEISADGTTYIKADSASNSGYGNSIDPMIFNVYKKARYIKIVFVSVFKSSGNNFNYGLCQIYSTSKDWKKITNTQKPTINSWSSNTEYEKDEIIVYSNKIYKCNKSHTSTTNFDSDKLIYWNSLNDNPIINDWASGVQYEEGSIVIVTNINGISKWKENTSYKIGDSVVYNGYVYTCSTANSDATFTENNWTLKEPVYNRIYRCITSNKDTTFDTSKWQLINGDAEATPQEVEDLLL